MILTADKPRLFLNSWVWNRLVTLWLQNHKYVVCVLTGSLTKDSSEISIQSLNPYLPRTDIPVREIDVYQYTP